MDFGCIIHVSLREVCLTLNFTVMSLNITNSQEIFSSFGTVCQIWIISHISHIFRPPNRVCSLYEVV